uniref:Uncharacterized protein n=1 Tax=Arundo donax TaxID=35708 RepID=A0A0A9GIW5_ARUDO
MGFTCFCDGGPTSDRCGAKKTAVIAGNYTYIVFVADSAIVVHGIHNRCHIFS